MLLCVFLLMPRQPCSTLFPYTTLFRSQVFRRNPCPGVTCVMALRWEPPDVIYDPEESCILCFTKPSSSECKILRDRIRSEEHTSELQSPMYLVCRLLLEKKNKKNNHR